MNGNKRVVHRVVHDPALALIVSHEEIIRDTGVVFRRRDIPRSFGSVCSKRIRNTFSFIICARYKERIIEYPGRAVNVSDEIEEAQIHFVSVFIIAVALGATGLDEHHRDLESGIGHAVLFNFERNNDQPLRCAKCYIFLVIFKAIRDSSV